MEIIVLAALAIFGLIAVIVGGSLLGAKSGTAAVRRGCGCAVLVLIGIGYLIWSAFQPSNDALKSERAGAATSASKEIENPEASTADATDASSDPNDTVYLGRCYMDSCSWHRTLGSQVLSHERNAVLIEMTLLGGSSPFGEGESDSHPRIEWNTAPHKVWVMCSPYFPAVAIADGGHYQVDLLDVRTIPGVMESSAGIYTEACEEDIILSDGVQKRYARIPGGSTTLTIDDPRELIALAKEAMNGNYPESEE